MPFIGISLIWKMISIYLHSLWFLSWKHFPLSGALLWQFLLYNGSTTQQVLMIFSSPQTDFNPSSEMQDGHPDSGESCDQDHHQLCGKLHTYLHFAHTSDIINKKRAIYNNTVWASNVFQAKKTLYTLSHNQAKETLYWGEYPLYFAACLGQEESYRLILARFLSLQTKLMPMMMLNVNMATFMLTTEKALLNFELQSLNKFLDAQASLAPTHVRFPSVRWSHFRISNLSAFLVALREKLKREDPNYFSILGLGKIIFFYPKNTFLTKKIFLTQKTF